MHQKEVKTLYLFINLVKVRHNSPNYILKTYSLPQFPLSLDY